jgi:hypothetical protein
LRKRKRISRWESVRAGGWRETAGSVETPPERVDERPGWWWRNRWREGEGDEVLQRNKR